MKKILTHLYNRLFKRNKSFIVWSANHPIKKSETNGCFTYVIKFYPYRTNKYELTYSPSKVAVFGVFYDAKAIEQPVYQLALKKLQEFQREELIDLIKLPSIEGVNIK